MRFKLVDTAGPKPYSKLGKTCAAGLRWDLHTVRVRRINRETKRRNLNEARFVAVPVLLMPDGTARIPRKYQAKHLSIPK